MKIEYTPLNNPPPHWRCLDRRCPVRVPAQASASPRCYTCGELMSAVPAPEPLVMIDGSYLLKPTKIDPLLVAALDRIRERATPVTIPPPTRGESQMREWITARRVWGRELRDKMNKETL